MGPLCVSVTVTMSDDEVLNKQRGAVDSTAPSSFTASEGNEKKKRVMDTPVVEEGSPL